MELTSSKLYCMLNHDTFDWSEANQLLPLRCEGCPYTNCFQCMRERVRDNVDKTQLEFQFV